MGSRKLLEVHKSSLRSGAKSKNGGAESLAKAASPATRARGTYLTMLPTLRKGGGPSSKLISGIVPAALPKFCLTPQSNPELHC